MKQLERIKNKNRDIFDISPRANWKRDSHVEVEVEVGGKKGKKRKIASIYIPEVQKRGEKEE